MILMHKIDGSELDGQLLRVFLAVLEEASVTRAALRLGLTQSAVSHALQRLNRTVGEVLFVKSGRGIVATARAEGLATQAREILEAMRIFAASGNFEPAETRFNLTIAANDLQRDLVLPALFQRIAKSAADIRLRVIPSEVPSVELLRRNGCDLVITPFPPEGSDIVQRRLFSDSYACFFDAAARVAPRSFADYLAARHASVVYPDGERLQFDKDLARLGIERRMAVSAPSFAGASAFLRGSDLLATMPSLLSGHLMRGFQSCKVPFEKTLRSKLPPLTMYLVWHRRKHQDAANVWVRKHLIDIAKAGI
jgi:DNA-binding transcriptional LysR family regulator